MYASHTSPCVLTRLLIFAACTLSCAQSGRLPLHDAVANNASEAVVKALLEAHPEAVRTEGPVRALAWSSHHRDPHLFAASSLAQDEEVMNALPLHIAAAHQASLAVVRILLEAHLEAAHTPDGTVSPAAS